MWVIGKDDKSIAQRQEQYTSLDYSFHPLYEWFHREYNLFDLAIVTVDRMVSFGRRVRPICLPKASEDFSDEKATVIGW
jgi:hypothetical protein